MPEDLEIRVLDRDDAAACRELRLYALRESPSAFLTSFEEEEEKRSMEEVVERIVPSEGRKMIGAFSGDAMIGMVGIGREERVRTAHKALLYAMYVHPDVRTRGVGRALVAQALDLARGMEGLRQVNLGVNAVNHAAHQLYLAMGFEPYGLEKAFMYLDGEAHDEIHMVCFL